MGGLGGLSVMHGARAIVMRRPLELTIVFFENMLQYEILHEGKPRKATLEKVSELEKQQQHIERKIAELSRSYVQELALHDRPKDDG